MNKYLKPISIIIVLTVSVLSGCNTQEATGIDKFKGIRFESSIVELVNASLDFLQEKNVIRKADVKYLFHNIAGRDVRVSVIVEFYDKNENLLVTGGPKYISIPKGYFETVYSPANIISYSGENVSKVDHVRLIAEES